jgi:hypothetical protein
LIQWSYWGGSNEIFNVNPTSDGYFNIQVRSSGKVLDVNGVSLSNGAIIQQWDSWGGDNQKWKVVPVQ